MRGKKSPLKKGDVAVISNADSCGSPRLCERDVTVKSIGHRWITASNGTKFDLDGHGEYGEDIFGVQELVDYKHRKTLEDGIGRRRWFQWRGLPIETLEAITALLKEADEAKGKPE